MEIKRAFTCACGQTGTAIWEGRARIEDHSPSSVLISISDGFFMQAAKTRHEPTVIVCGICNRTVTPSVH
jgi:hypothetical protein